MWRLESIYEGITYAFVVVLFCTNSKKVTVFAQELQTLQILIEIAPGS